MIANENLKKPYIRAFIEQRVKEVEDKLDITFEDKAKLLWLIAKKCSAEGEWAGQEFIPNATINGIAELNKMQGHYKKEKDIEEDIDEMKEKLRELVRLNKKEY